VSDAISSMIPHAMHPENPAAIVSQVGRSLRTPRAAASTQ